MESDVKDNIDISENDLSKLNNGKVLIELLTDHSRRDKLRQETGEAAPEAFIIWATDDYSGHGEGYTFHDQIRPELITGEHGTLIVPRVLKRKDLQQTRVKDKAEVFTPSWVCNAQNNLIDEAWFGRPNVFNTEEMTPDGEHTWTPAEGKISFEGTGKTWKDYVRDTRMEITCGEGPYLVSRYDATTGQVIPLSHRIGLFDRKMRIVNENVETLEEWRDWTRTALQNTYGYEWQGDNLLLAREAIFRSSLEYYEDFQRRLGLKPKKMLPQTMQSFSYIISWNLWQMDGLKFVTPESCTKIEVCTNQKEIDAANNDPFRQMFADEAEPIPEPKYEMQDCPGCTAGDNTKHTGIYALIRDWEVWESNRKKKGEKNKANCEIRFIDLINH